MEPNNTIPPINPITQTPTQKEERSIGPAIGIIVIIAIIILGGLYFWGQRLAQQPNTTVQEQTQTPVTQTQEEVTPGADLNQLQNQGSSDDLNSIQADLNSTDLNNLGTEVNSINTEAQTSGSVQAQ